MESPCKNIEMCMCVCTSVAILFRTISGIFANLLKTDGPYGNQWLVRFRGKV